MPDYVVTSRKGLYVDSGFSGSGVAGIFWAGFLAMKTLQVLSLLTIMNLAAAEDGILGIEGAVGLIVGVVLKATITASSPLLSVARGLSLAHIVTLAILQRMLRKIKTAKERLARLWRWTLPATQKLPFKTF